MTPQLDPILFLLVGLLTGVASTLLAARIPDFISTAQAIAGVIRRRSPRPGRSE